jgi:hypothetical protein
MVPGRSSRNEYSAPFVFLLASLGEGWLGPVPPSSPVQREIMSVPGRYHPSNFPVEASMTVRRSIIAMSGAALLLCTSGALNAQQAPPAEKETTVVRDDEDRDWGWDRTAWIIGTCWPVWRAGPICWPGAGSWQAASAGRLVRHAQREAQLLKQPIRRFVLRMNGQRDYLDQRARLLRLQRLSEWLDRLPQRPRTHLPVRAW